MIQLRVIRGENEGRRVAFRWDGMNISSCSEKYERGRHKQFMCCIMLLLTSAEDRV